MRNGAWVGIVLFLLLAASAHATGIGNVPERAARDFVFHPGLHRSYTFAVFGAETIDTQVSASSEIRKYVTLTDAAPKTGPRTVNLDIKFPDDAALAPGNYYLTFSANEIASGTSQISTSVSVSLGFTIRSYSKEPLLEVTDVFLTATPKGERANFTVNVISRSLEDIPALGVDVVVLNESGDVVATGHANHGNLPATETASILGSLNTENLAGGIYPTNATVAYGAKSAYWDQAILRVGTLTIDLSPDYTQTFTYNQTNKFTFKLLSNWNKPLTRVSATVRLLGQAKTSASTDITAFGTSEPLELYFDRTETPPGPVEGKMTVTYQELGPNPALQDQIETHTFTIPIHVNIVLPQEPIKAKTPFKVTTAEIVISIAVLLLIINIVVVYFLLRRRPKEEKPQPAPPQGPG